MLWCLHYFKRAIDEEVSNSLGYSFSGQKGSSILHKLRQLDFDSPTQFEDHVNSAMAPESKVLSLETLVCDNF